MQIILVQILNCIFQGASEIIFISRESMNRVFSHAIGHKVHKVKHTVLHFGGVPGNQGDTEAGDPLKASGKSRFCLQTLMALITLKSVLRCLRIIRPVILM